MSVLFSVKNNGLNISTLSDGFLKSNSSANISTTSTIDTNDLSNSIKTRLNTIESDITTLQSSSGLPELSDGFVKSVSGSLTSGNINISDVTNLQNTLNTIGSNITTLQNASGGSSGLTEEEVTTISTNISTIVATNIAQQPAKNISNFGRSWSQFTNSPTDNGVGMGASGNGQYILKLGWGAQSHLSTDFGASWSPVSDLGYYQWATSMSFDGKYMIATTITGGAMISNNYGSSWSHISIAGTPQNSKISFNGKNIVIATTNGVYSSTNFGSTFTSINSGSWKSVTASSDGQTIFAVKNSSPPTILKTTNNGSTWSTIYSNPDSVAFDTMSCSADGKYVLVGLGQNVSGFMYLSNDYGSTFSPLNATNELSQGNYFKVDMDASGMYMVSVCNSGFMFYSTNFGKNWSQSPLSSNGYWGVAISDNGNNIYVYIPGTKLYSYDANIITIPTSQPGVPGKGGIYYDESTNKLYVYNSSTSSWKSVTLA
jgi:hypothetical protein